VFHRPSERLNDEKRKENISASGSTSAASSWFKRMLEPGI
jgi:hypothetical protein